MISEKLKKALISRVLFSVVLGIIGMFMAGPLISYLVKSTDAFVASGDIASGFKMRIWVAGAFFLIPWMIELNQWWFRYKPNRFQNFAIVMLFVFALSYSFIRIFFAVQFYDFWKIDGVIQYVDLRYFNLGRHIIMGMILGFIFSMAVGFFKRRAKSSKYY